MDGSGSILRAFVCEREYLGPGACVLMNRWPFLS